MADLFISCVEPSGDRLAADALALVLARRPTLDVIGCAGPRLRALGVTAVVEMESVAVMGISAVLARLPSILRARATLREALEQRPPVALFVDGPSMHLTLAAGARARGTRTVGLVSPQIWAWKPDRTAAIGQAYHDLMCLFDFEPPLLQAAFAVHGGCVWHVGHPVLDRLPAASERRSHPSPLFGLAPGSRTQELVRHLGPFLATAEAVRRQIPGARFRLAGPLPPGAPAWVEAVRDIQALQPCHAVLTKSGTVTLELAWMGVPQVVAHAVSPLTAAMGRRLVRHVDHIALPNVLNRSAVVPETIGRPHPERLAAALLEQRDTPPVPLPGLGRPGATERIAAHLLTALESPHRPDETGPTAGGRLPGAP